MYITPFQNPPSSSQCLIFLVVALAFTEPKIFRQQNFLIWLVSLRKKLKMKICLEFLKNLEDLLSSKFILSSSGEEINVFCIS